jgi:hypothetical protein
LGWVRRTAQSWRAARCVKVMPMSSRRAFTHSVLAAAVVASAGRATRAAPAPTLVELFTSQGCSSCPPADDTLARLSTRPEVASLAFHVDYWDHLGWKDPFAEKAFTRRQRAYRAAFGNRSIYTPQMVFAGRLDLPGQGEGEALSALNRARALGAPAPSLLVQRQGEHEVRIEIGAGPVDQAMVVFAAVAGTTRSTNVRRGENAGRRLINTNIVTRLDVLGPYAGAARSIAWQPGLEGAAKLVVWVQPEALGPVLAVAQLRIAASA